jgi:dTDP-4-amino-4,6-dideoxygalactose transaminase
MNEFQALMGLEVLKHLESMIQHRRQIDALYRHELRNVPGLRFPPLPAKTVDYNFAYFPIEIDAEEFGGSRDQLYEELKRFNVFARRYFYPLICDYVCYRSLQISDPLIEARQVAQRILTLPIYDALRLEDVQRMCDIVRWLCPRLQGTFDLSLSTS